MSPDQGNRLSPETALGFYSELARLLDLAKVAGEYVFCNWACGSEVRVMRTGQEVVVKYDRQVSIAHYGRSVDTSLMFRFSTVSNAGLICYGSETGGVTGIAGVYEMVTLPTELTASGGAGEAMVVTCPGAARVTVYVRGADETYRPLLVIRLNDEGDAYQLSGSLLGDTKGELDVTGGTLAIGEDGMREVAITTVSPRSGRYCIPAVGYCDLNTGVDIGFPVRLDIATSILKAIADIAWERRPLVPGR